MKRIRWFITTLVVLAVIGSITPLDASADELFFHPSPDVYTVKVGDVFTLRGYFAVIGVSGVSRPLFYEVLTNYPQGPCCDPESPILGLVAGFYNLSTLQYSYVEINGPGYLGPTILVGPTTAITDIRTFTVLPTARPGTYSHIYYPVFGGFNSMQGAPFTVVVAAPEPSSIVLLVGAMLGVTALKLAGFKPH